MGRMGWSNSNLHQETNEPQTIQLDFLFDNTKVGYNTGDHLTVFPRNQTEKVEYLKSRLNNNPPPDTLVSLLVSNGGIWKNIKDLCLETSFTDFFYYFFDINIVPSQDMLKIFAASATDEKEKAVLTKLAHDDVNYDMWSEESRDICQTLKEFSSISIDFHRFDENICLIPFYIRRDGT